MSFITANQFRFLRNPSFDRAAAYDENGRAEILSEAAFRVARDEIASWDGYRETPLRGLPNLAKALVLKQVLLKDEGERFGLGSFKALGGAYAVFRFLQRELKRRTGVNIKSEDLVSGAFADATSDITVTCATDGNHGRSVAWGAKRFGCRCVIYVHASVSDARCEAIAACGAEVRRVAGNYDDAVRQAASDASEFGWGVISDTSYPGYVDVPRDVMQGYSLMVEEALLRFPDRPTHVFVQGGVGALAAAACSHLWQRYGSQRPTFVVVEPAKADCLFQSAAAGKPTVVHGELDTIMAGLACGEVSLLAWRILQPGADAFMTITDEAAAEAMRLLADATFGDEPVVAGESAVAGLAALMLMAEDPGCRASLGLSADSTVLLFGTEGATDPAMYRHIVGRDADEVKAAAA
ncbi:MAG: diaminopropionate ammonia-lyase [Methylobacteriaceae bacterium]|nr:diaminopropionate ammonia-lyase [Methylobacteriaceae bacterium]